MGRQSRDGFSPLGDWIGKRPRLHRKTRSVACPACSFDPIQSLWAARWRTSSRSSESSKSSSPKPNWHLSFFKGLSIKEMSDLRDRLRACDSVCKVTKNTLMRRAIDDDSNWASLDSLLTGTNAFVLVKGDVGAGVKAVQTFQKELNKSETKGGLFEGKLLSQDEIKAIADLPSKEQLMAQIAGAINAVATKVAVGINEVPSGMARALKQHAEGGEG